VPAQRPWWSKHDAGIRIIIRHRMAQLGFQPAIRMLRLGKMLTLAWLAVSSHLRSIYMLVQNWRSSSLAGKNDTATQVMLIGSARNATAHDC